MARFFPNWIAYYMHQLTGTLPQTPPHQLLPSAPPHDDPPADVFDMHQMTGTLPHAPPHQLLPSAPPHDDPPADVFDITGTSVASLQNFLDPVPDVTCRQALVILLPHCPGLSLATLDGMLLANGYEVQHIDMAGLVDHELKLAVRMFTVEQPYAIYHSFNNPFFNRGRSPLLLQHHAAYCRLLLRATLCLMQQPQHVYEGPAYRGLSIAQNAELRLKYNDHKTGFPVGSLLTFAAFTSVSLHDHVAQDFGDHVLFTFTRVRGVRIRALSAEPQEAEVLVPPPSVFRILAVAMFHGTLVVTLEQQMDSPLTYLTLPPPPPIAPVLPPAPAVPPPDVVASALQASNWPTISYFLSTIRALISSPVAGAVQPASLELYAAPGKHVRHNGYIYAVAHVHNVDCRDLFRDGNTFVVIDPGFEVAPGDASDIEVANAHAWGSYALVFSDGAWAATALWLAKHPFTRDKKYRDINWWKYFWNTSDLPRDGARVAAKWEDSDVLMRRRAD